MAFATAGVCCLVAYWFTRNRRWLAWAAFIGKAGIGLVLLFGLLYVIERLVLI